MATAAEITDVLVGCENRIKGIATKAVDADDLFQATAMNALANGESCEGQTADEIQAWVISVAYRARTSAWRKSTAAKRDSRRTQGIERHDAIESEAPSEVAEDRELAQELVSRLEQLPAQAAAIIRMRYLGQREASEVAEELGITRQQVNYKLCRAMTRLRKLSADLVA